MEERLVKQIVVQVSDETATSLYELAARCTDENERRDGFTSHGALGVSSLMAMLAEDAAMAITRPGSWEGANMAQVFSSHGYEV
jgi:hypothetical protein